MAILIKKEKKESPNKKSLNFFSYFVSSEEKNYFIENLSMLLAAGMNILTAIEAIEAELKSRPMKKIIAGLKEDIESGLSLSQSLKKTRLFSSYNLALIQIGEQSGRLPENLKAINSRQQREAAFNAKVKTAMLYPAFVLSFTLIVGLTVSWFILPRLASVFSATRLDLPWATRSIIFFGNFLTENGLILIPSIIAILVIFSYFIFFFKKTKFIGEALLFKLPIIKKFIQEVQLSRFGYILGTLLESGLPITEAVSSLNQSIKFRAYNKFYKHLGESIESGNSFQESFYSYKNIKKLIPVPIQQMIITGEKSGSLSQILLKIGNNFEEKTDNSAKNLTVFIEPILLILVGLGVAFIAIGVILPIYSLIGNLGGPSPNNRVNNISVESNQIKTDGEITNLTEEKNIFIEIIGDEQTLMPIYSQADTNSLILEQVMPGDYFKFLAEEDIWYQIQLPEDKTGWLLKENGEIR